jgi:succinyl-diaminopimelate desuccinylase
MSRSATAIAAEVMGELAALADLPVVRVNNIAAVLDEAAPVIDQACGRGASGILQRVTVNVGLIHGDLKVNMIATECDFELDIRLPIGLTAPAVLAGVDKIIARRPEVSYAQVIYDPPSRQIPLAPSASQTAQASQLLFPAYPARAPQQRSSSPLAPSASATSQPPASLLSVLYCPWGPRAKPLVTLR